MKLKVKDKRVEAKTVRIEFVTFGTIVEIKGVIYQVAACHKNIHAKNIIFDKDKAVLAVNMKYGIVELLEYGTECKVLKAELILIGAEDGTEF